MLAHPRKKLNRRGELKFHLTAAAKYLQEDIKDGLNKEFTPMELQSLRPEYMLFDLEVFKRRIYQEEKLQKWYNFRDDQKKAYELALYGEAVPENLPEPEI